MNELIQYFQALEARLAAQDERIAALEQRLAEKNRTIVELNDNIEAILQILPKMGEHIEAMQKILDEGIKVVAEPEPEAKEETAPEPQPAEEAAPVVEPVVEPAPEPVVEPAPVAEPAPVVEQPKAEPVIEQPKPAPQPEAPRVPQQTSLFGAPVTDIRQAVSIGDRFLFQRELFAGNAERLQQTLTELNALSTLDEAIAFVDKFGWDKQTPTYELFINVLRRRFQ
ncbi:MAG: hypothetical protein J6T76_05990 [Paludibacteraceae bacterium]|nr:hypothetical protein [Paludibacteraceae bacterium]